MLNAGNLALLAFARSIGNQDGQVFALVVMVVAACEVVVGLGLIVAMFRRRLPLNVDEMRGLQGMSATDFGWLVLLFPLVGSIVIGLGCRVLPGRTAGWIGTGGDRARRSHARSARSSDLLDRAGRRPPAHLDALRLRDLGRPRHPAGHPASTRWRSSCAWSSPASRC